MPCPHPLPTPTPIHSEGALRTFTEGSSVGKDTVVLLLVPLTRQRTPSERRPRFLPCSSHPEGCLVPSRRSLHHWMKKLTAMVFSEEKSHMIWKRIFFLICSFIYMKSWKGKTRHDQDHSVIYDGIMTAGKTGSWSRKGWGWGGRCWGADAQPRGGSARAVGPDGDGDSLIL